MTLKGDEVIEGQDPPVEPDAAPVTPPAQPDPAEERFRLMQDDISGLRHQLSTFLAPQVGQPPAAAPPPKFEFYSPRQIAERVGEGDHETAEAMREHNASTRMAQAEYKMNKEVIEPLRTGGQAALDQLNDRVFKDEQKHLDIPEVKRDYEGHLRILQRQGHSINPEARRYIYHQAVGAHLDKVMEKEKRGMLRAAEPTGASPQAPGKTSGRGAGKMGDEPVPTPEEVWGHSALAGLKMAGRSVEEELRRRGYKDWPSYVKAVHVS